MRADRGVQGGRRRSARVQAHFTKAQADLPQYLAETPQVRNVSMPLMRRTFRRPRPPLGNRWCRPPVSLLAEASASRGCRSDRDRRGKPARCAGEPRPGSRSGSPQRPGAQHPWLQVCTPVSPTAMVHRWPVNGSYWDAVDEPPIMGQSAPTKHSMPRTTTSGGRHLMRVRSSPGRPAVRCRPGDWSGLGRRRPASRPAAGTYRRSLADLAVFPCTAWHPRQRPRPAPPQYGRCWLWCLEPVDRAGPGLRRQRGNRADVRAAVRQPRRFARHELTAVRPREKESS